MPAQTSSETRAAILAHHRHGLSGQKIVEQLKNSGIFSSKSTVTGSLGNFIRSSQALPNLRNGWRPSAYRWSALRTSSEKSTGSPTKPIHRHSGNWHNGMGCPEVRFDEFWRMILELSWGGSGRPMPCRTSRCNSDWIEVLDSYNSLEAKSKGISFP